MKVGVDKKNLVSPSPSSPPARGGEVPEEFILRKLKGNSQRSRHRNPRRTKAYGI